jgi:hypothetical protein
MKEHPILFSAPMVRVILEGRKTQTRRVMKFQPIDEPCVMRASLTRTGTKPVTVATWLDVDDRCCICPYGNVGDQLWVREAQAVSVDAAIYRADYTDDAQVRMPKMLGFKWIPSIHMRREFSRIQLEITGIRVERLQDISDDDALAEGVISYPVGNLTVFGVEGTKIEKLHPRAAYLALWDEINGRGSVDTNPWVWVVEFKVIKP